LHQMTNVQKKKLNLPQWLSIFISGGIAGCTAKTVIAPLERVKILFQTKNSHFAFSSVLSSMNKIIKSEGYLDLWKGNTATLIRVYPYAAIQFLSYEQFKKLIITDHTKKPHPLEHLVCGSLAGMSAVTFTYPLDLIRARMASQVEHNVYRNVFHGLYVMYKEEGLKAWFRGMRPTIQGIIPYAGVNFTTYEFLKNYAPKDDKGEVTVVGKLMCGGISGPIGQTVAYPWDTVRRRAQIWGFVPGTAYVTQKSSIQAMIFILRTEGLKGLFRGISINYVKATPTVAISFAVYETVKKYMMEL